MSYIVDRIPGNVRIDPDAGGEGRQRRREKRPPKGPTTDSVSISDEARRRSGEEGEQAREPE
jgi:hypothetical protein